MKRFLFILILAVAHFTCQAQTWSLDKAHAKLGFSITHLMVSDIEGSFKNFDIKLTSSKDDFSDAVVELSADVTSVNTENDKRDQHLQTPDFFDAAKYPKLTFKSTSFKKVEGNKYNVAGDLTLHGVTKPVELDVVLRGPTVHPYTKKTIAGFKVTGTIKRIDFGISANTPAAALGDDVTITANSEFIKD